MILVNNENPKEHWQFVSVNNRIVLDLGCGRWEHVEYRDQTWPTTPEFFKNKGAKLIIGLDSDDNEIEWFSKNFANNDSYKFISRSIDSSEILKELIISYTPNCVKVDIEGGEIHLVNLDDDTFNLVDEYYIETHDKNLFDLCEKKLKNNNYTIVNLIDLVHTGGACKVIFAKK